MYQTINVYDFREAFKRMGRDKAWTYEGLGALFDFLEDMELSESQKLDVIALDCDFAEYTEDEAMSEFGYLLEGIDDEQKTFDVLKEHLYDETLIVEVDNGNIIVQGF